LPSEGSSHRKKDSMNDTGSHTGTHSSDTNSNPNGNSTKKEKKMGKMKRFMSMVGLGKNKAKSSLANSGQDDRNLSFQFSNNGDEDEKN